MTARWLVLNQIAQCGINSHGAHLLVTFSGDSDKRGGRGCVVGDVESRENVRGGLKGGEGMDSRVSVLLWDIGDEEGWGVRM